MNNTANKPSSTVSGNTGEIEREALAGILFPHPLNLI